MKTNKFIAFMLLAAMATGCTKDNEVIPAGNPEAKYLTIFANQFDGNGSKVSFDPSAPSNAQWVDGDSVMLNNVVYAIAKFPTGHPNEGKYGLQHPNTHEFIQPLTSNMTSLYPGASFGGNEVEVSPSEIIMKRLVIGFNGRNNQSVAFPMEATANGSSTSLNYNHLTGAVRVRLRNPSTTDVDVASLRIVAQGNGALDNLSVNGVTARWQFDGPWMPGYQVGDNDDEDIDVKYASVMDFDLRDLSDVENIRNFMTIAADDELSFCVPITIKVMKKLQVTGYDKNGAVLFHVKKEFNTANTIEANHIYNLPIININ